MEILYSSQDALPLSDGPRLCVRPGQETRGGGRGRGLLGVRENSLREDTQLLAPQAGEQGRLPWVPGLHPHAAQPGGLAPPHRAGKLPQATASPP